MKRFIHSAPSAIILVLIACVHSVYAQNLVLNPSFETYSSCPTGPGSFAIDVTSWSMPDTASTDYYNACYTPPFPMPGITIPTMDVPANIQGYQYARTGVGYAGIICRDNTMGIDDNYREYAQGQFSAPLIAGQSYCVKFYWSLADSSNYSVNEMGVYLSNTQINLMQTENLPFTPQLEQIGSPLNDTTHWVAFQKNYIAIGGETYFIIGNFRAPANTTSTSTGKPCALIPSNGGCFAYYYLDDVSVTPGSCCLSSITPVGPFCTNDPSIPLTPASTGGTWSGPGVNASGIFNPATAGVGVHNIVYSLACGSDSIQIIVSPCISLSACVETNGTITVSNGVSPYNWTVYTPATTTAITNQTECTACGGSWLFGTCLSGVTPIDSCVSPASWSNFATGTNSGTLPGTYPIQVTDGISTTLQITSLASLPSCSGCPALTAVSASIVNVNCFGQSTGSFSVTTTGGASPYDYILLNGTTTIATFNNVVGAQSFTGLSAGTYTLNVVDNNACPGSASITITQPATALSGGITTSTSATCGVSNGSATVQANGGTPGYTYNWSPTGGTSATGNGLAAGSYTVTITDTKGCTFPIAVTISSTGGATISTSQTNVLCFGASTGSATATASSGSSPYDYVWTGASGTLQTTNNITGPNVLNNIAAGSYTVSVTDNNSCVTSYPVTITQPALPLTVAITAFTNTPCGISNGTATALASGGTGTITYAWTPSGGSGSTATGLAAGTYTVTATDGNTCTSSSFATIGSIGGPVVTLVSQTNVLCYGSNTGSATISALGGTGALTYSWSGGAGSGTTASNLQAGTYIVTVTDASGCQAPQQVIITQPSSAISANVNTAASNCGSSNGSATATATGGTGSLTYAWSAPGGTSATLSNIPNGTYTVTVTDDNFCTQTASGVVAAIGGPSADAGTSATIVAGSSTILIGTGPTGSTYSWTPASTLTNANTSTPSASPLQTTVYTLTVTQNGCTATDSVTIFVELPCGELFVPTAFSPDGGAGSENEVLKVFGNCISSLEFTIFDRWGEKVFETSNPSVGWDGTYKGKKLDTGVFVFFLKATVDGIEVKKHGNITLVK